MGRLLDALRRLEQRQTADGACTAAPKAEWVAAEAASACQSRGEQPEPRRAATDQVLAELIDIGMAARQAAHAAEHRPAKQPVAIGAELPGASDTAILPGASAAVIRPGASVDRGETMEPPQAETEPPTTDWAACDCDSRHSDRPEFFEPAAGAPTAPRMAAEQESAAATEPIDECELVEPWELTACSSPAELSSVASSADSASAGAVACEMSAEAVPVTEREAGDRTDWDGRWDQLAAAITERWGDALPAVLLIASAGDGPRPEWLGDLARRLETSVGTAVAVRTAGEVTVGDLLKLRRRHQLTLIAASPTDADLATLAADSDGAYLCVRLGRDRVGDIEQTAAKILAPGGLIAGLIAQ